MTVVTVHSCCNCSPPPTPTSPCCRITHTTYKYYNSSKAAAHIINGAGFQGLSDPSFSTHVVFSRRLKRPSPSHQSSMYYVTASLNLNDTFVCIDISKLEIFENGHG